ncbi:MAG: hypothetical protein M4579_005112 [Chaenotheca gracillima]|nr:MAG: hypothetical protein M4579_005112 [Chaenotheca gracillima]
MLGYIEFVTTPTADTRGTSLILHFQTKRYLIGNFVEGLSRAVFERGLKSIKLQDCFVTGPIEWRNVGGLLGFLMTVADAASSSTASSTDGYKSKKANLERQLEKARQHAKPRNVQMLEQSLANTELRAQDQTRTPLMTLHGARNLTHTLATARRFVFRKGMPVGVNEWRSELYDAGNEAGSALEPTWSDELVRVWVMTIAPEKSTPSSPAVGSRSRKRSHAELDKEDGLISGEETQDRQDQMRRAIVSEMFNSDWRLDALKEVPLSEVQMPARLFQRNPGSGHIESYNGPSQTDVLNGTHPDPTVLVRNPWPGATIETLPPTTPFHDSTCYIFKAHYQRGKFQPERALELGVKEGAKFSVLAQGGSVTTEAGNVVTAEMVLEEGREGHGVAVLDLPTRGHVQGLIDRREWTNAQLMNGIKVMVWILGQGVGDDPRLLKFIKARPQFEHIFSSVDHCSNEIAFPSAAAAAHRLNEVDPNRHKIPFHEVSTATQPDEQNEERQSPDFGTPAKVGKVIVLEPRYESRPAPKPFDSTAVSFNGRSKVLALADEAKSRLKDPETMKALEAAQRDMPGKDAEIITLGTGSALPSKYRNVSATLLRIPGKGSYLFDCGENTLGQLARVYSPPELAEVLRDLKMIWISHLHADHHLGTVSVIKAWYNEVWKGVPKTLSTFKESYRSKIDQIRGEEGAKRLAVFAGHPMLKFLEDYDGVEDFGHSRILPFSVNGIFQRPDGQSGRVATAITWADHQLGLGLGLDTTLRETVFSRLGISDFQSVMVQHCHGSQAVSITWPDGFKFSYSGDCRPSLPFQEIGKDTTVLVHEATFDDELIGDARAKKHSTTSEAIGVGVGMGARRIILTHFSQRYQKIPVLGDIDPFAAREPSSMEDAYPDSPPPSPPPISQQSIKENRVAPVSIRRAAYDLKVGVAFDLMRVKVGEINQLEYFTPALSILLDQELASEKDSDKRPDIVMDEGSGKTKKAKGKLGKPGKPGRHGSPGKKFLG